MASPHLTTGSQQPPKIEGKLRLYSMQFCPYAQRARLVLKAKNIPHDIVNINLINKPEWYTKVHPEGKVPALDTGSKIVVESLDIADFLDAEYPNNNPLYSSDKNRDKELIKKIAPITDLFYKCVAKTENKSLEEWAKAFVPHLEVFERDLAARGTTFFGGDKPGMVDYMLWPWGERAGTIAIAHGAQLPFGSDQFPCLRKWRKAMREDKICSEIYNGPEKFWKCVEMKLKNLPPDYDSI
ncbi:pyrimidodiazepine synthase [Tribolium castaneum]|uniref:Glutathione S-transferase omega-2-like Protein n=1 Tax=Tribolium castaneum TaxID=7070 RepID=D6WDC0_TRICA|nr:PREDICTED: pyrimidodiazepine synthase [Tribolium castaneum]EEZ99479.1 Glutathione S-transferase omega-2-like Protein [Tribolium castaneum]|eukprot:XP_971247.1 PREDICTED: pyrimidodiazepine synthase [Tribolium castaneum]